MPPLQKNNTHPTKAILWILLCKAHFAILMACIKYADFPTLQLNFIRSFIVAFVSFPIILSLYGLKGIKTHQIGPQLIRVTSGAVAMMCFFYAFDHMSMAKATTLVAAQTLFIPVLAFFVLKEKIRARRWTAIIVGYTGIWIALNPIYGSLETVEGIALLGAFLAAIANISAKKLVATDKPLVLMFFSALASIFLLALYYWHIPFLQSLGWSVSPWKNIEIENLPILLGMSGAALISQFSYLSAFRYGDISFLAPFDYSKFIFSTVLGFFIFQEYPAYTTWIGMALIVLSTLYISYREKALKLPQKKSSYDVP